MNDLQGLCSRLRSDTDIAFLKDSDHKQIRAHGNTPVEVKRNEFPSHGHFSSENQSPYLMSSGLDPMTRDTVLTRVFDPKGLVRERVVIVLPS